VKAQEKNLAHPDFDAAYRVFLPKNQRFSKIIAQRTEGAKSGLCAELGMDSLWLSLADGLIDTRFSL
jgi:hypothetical protein